MRIRRRSEVHAQGDDRWFRPALDRVAALQSDSDDRARSLLDVEKSLIIARAPGRLDVMGGIADYSGATVLQLPLDRSTSVIGQVQRERRIDVATRRRGVWSFFSVDVDALLSSELSDASTLAAWFQSRPKDLWAAYVIGAVQYCLMRVSDASKHAGLRLLVDSTVPEGKGVSSSAALEVPVMSVAAAAFAVDLTPEEIAAACQWVENHIVGAPCGIMDQMTSACGRKDRLLRLRCQPGTIEGHLEIPNGYHFYGIDSGVRHAVSGADYGTVRTAAFMGYRIIADAVGLTSAMDHNIARVDDPHWRGHLTNIPRAEFANRFESLLPERMRGSDFLARYSGITDTVTQVIPERDYPIRRATAHPVYEQDRVTRFASLLSELPERPSAAHELGALMYESHASYSACGLGSDGTDRLVELIAEAGHEHGEEVFGAKITGGGSGGTVAVLGRATALATVKEIASRYSRETGRESEVFAESGPGAGQTGILILE